MSEQEKLERQIRSEIPEEFPKFQATYVKGPLNFTARTSESEIVALQALNSMLKESLREEDGKPVYPYVRKVVREIEKVEKKSSSSGWLHPCPVHKDTEMEFREGVSKKSGKPYAGWFCPVEGCDEVEWESKKGKNA